MMKLLVIAFNNFENIISHCKAISNKADITLVLMLSGDSCKSGTFDLNISDLKPGLITDKKIVNSYLPFEINEYLQGGIKIWFLKTMSRKLLKDYTLKNFLTIRRAALYLRKIDFDIIHFNATGGFMFYFFYYFKNIKKVLTLHDYKAHSGEENWKSDFINKIISKYNIHYIQFYKYLEKEFIQYYKVKPEIVHQIYTGKLEIYTYFKSKNIFSDLSQNQFILFFGRISKYKGIDYLIKGFNLFCTNHPESKMKLVIAGYGKYWFDINITKNNPNIYLINRYIDAYEQSELINKCKFVVLPYTDATHSAVVMTSYAFNKPILATDVGGLKEVIIDKKTGLLIKPRNVYEIANGIELMLKDNEMLKEYGKNIEKICADSEFSWNYISRKMISIYKIIFNFDK